MAILNINPNITGKDLRKGFDVRGYAAKRKMNIESVSLSDGTTAKILSNGKEIDCFTMKNGKILKMKGYKGNLNFLFDMRKLLCYYFFFVLYLKKHRKTYDFKRLDYFRSI